VADSFSLSWFLSNLLISSLSTLACSVSLIEFASISFSNLRLFYHHADPSLLSTALPWCWVLGLSVLSGSNETSRTMQYDVFEVFNGYRLLLSFLISFQPLTDVSLSCWQLQYWRAEGFHPKEVLLNLPCTYTFIMLISCMASFMENHSSWRANKAVICHFNLPCL